MPADAPSLSREIHPLRALQHRHGVRRALGVPRGGARRRSKSVRLSSARRWS